MGPPLSAPTQPKIGFNESARDLLSFCCTARRPWAHQLLSSYPAFHSSGGMKAELQSEQAAEAEQWHSQHLAPGTGLGGTSTTC